jgi:hypothetical protein
MRDELFLKYQKLAILAAEYPTIENIEKKLIAYKEFRKEFLEGGK